MRIFIAVRTRFAEDALAAAVEHGVSQLVVLGAGLDTYAYRTALRDQLRIFEVDHPATQAWKRERLEQAAIPVPDSLTFAPIDFEHETLEGGLATAGFDRTKQTFFTWLGVIPYLREEAIWSTLGFIANLANGAHVVFDYGDPPSSLPPELKSFHDERAARVSELGEAWVSYFDAETMRAKLTVLGFSKIEDLGPSGIADRYFPGHVPSSGDKGGHVLYAATV
jgi:methyltransferase (TIGR00027 family)